MLRTSLILVLLVPLFACEPDAPGNNNQPPLLSIFLQDESGQDRLVATSGPGDVDTGCAAGTAIGSDIVAWEAGIYRTDLPGLTPDPTAYNSTHLPPFRFTVIASDPDGLNITYAKFYDAGAGSPATVEVTGISPSHLTNELNEYQPDYFDDVYQRRITTPSNVANQLTAHEIKFTMSRLGMTNHVFAVTRDRNYDTTELWVRLVPQRFCVN